jgi:hypothetical protein
MIVDTLTVLDLLRERGIRVVRSRYVTNAKQAVAFAARGPIALRLVPASYGGGSSLALTDLTTSTTVRRAYDLIAAQAAKFAGGQILARIRTRRDAHARGLDGAHVRDFREHASSRLTLDQVRLHADSYAVLDATLEMRRATGLHHHPARYRFA